MIPIIGAGPSGSYAAYLLVKSGKDVSVIEEHKEIGKPVQCTGIVTHSINKIIKLKKDVIVNKVRDAVIYSPDRSHINIRMKKPNIIIDRHRFDRQISDMALDEGAKFFLSTKFSGLTKRGFIVRSDGNKREVACEKIVGADGPASSVAKSAGIFGKRNFWTGIQVRARYENSNEVEFYPYIGSFAWVVPENEKTARIGLLAEKNAKIYFKRFLKKKNVSEKKIISYQAGIVPYYNPSLNTQKGRVYLLGDAATQVKATTGGGIIQGLEAAGCLAESILYSGSYEKLWKKRLGKDLWMHLMMRKVMNTFSDRDWNNLTRIMSGEDAKKILETHDRDQISKFALKLILKEPKLLMFGKNIVKSLFATY